MYPYFKDIFKNCLVIPVNGYGLPMSKDTLRITQTIEKNPNCELIIFDKSDGPTNNELEYIEWAKTLGTDKKFIIVTSNYHYHYRKHPTVVHFPRYFFTLLQDKNLAKFDIAQPRPFRISCLARNPWLHKSFNVVAMSKQPWFKEIQLSFGVDDPMGKKEMISTDLLKLISADDAQYLKTVYPIKLNLNDDATIFESNACPTFQYCYADYAPESRYDNIFISEKTWKPIFSGQFFFILGAVGTVQYLRDVGVDVFDDVVDHSYDQEPDLVAKVSMLMQSITEFLNHDLDRLWVSTLSRRQKNLDLVYDPAFQQRMSADLFSRVS